MFVILNSKDGRCTCWHVCYTFIERLFARPWTDLEGQVINISGLEAGAQGRIQRVALKLGDRKPESDDSKVLADTHNLPAVQLLFSVFLQHSEQNMSRRPKISLSFFARGKYCSFYSSPHLYFNHSSQISRKIIMLICMMRSQVADDLWPAAACHSARPTSGSVRPPAASPCSPAGCWGRATRSSRPSPAPPAPGLGPVLRLWRRTVTTTEGWSGVEAARGERNSLQSVQPAVRFTAPLCSVTFEPLQVSTKLSPLKAIDN